MFTYFCDSFRNNSFIKHTTMAVTTLKRKLKRKRQSQTTRVIKIKQLSAMPVIKNVDIEELKKSFGK
jgi:hypothetical protein